MPSFADVMTELEAVGTEQARKIYARHGVKPPMFGVSYANFKLFVKRIKQDHALAVQLWDSGNYDARVLSMMIADPKQADPAQLDAWVAACDNYGIVDALNTYVSRTAYARAKAEAWSPSPDEWMSTAGWGLLSHLATDDKTLPDSYFSDYLALIESGIHQRPNRTRYAMNTALITIGCRTAALHERVKHITAVIGTVQVDHGQTGCKTPQVVPYIEKALAHKGYALA